MPRTKKISDKEILGIALTLIEEKGSEGLTFALLAERCGLSGSTLVQRFGSKQLLIDAAISLAWDALELQTSQVAQEEPQTAAGAIAILCRLSTDYGDIDSYADKLHILREDLRNPAFRARGKAWIISLATLLDGCFAAFPAKPAGIGELMIAQWQGALMLWAFSPDEHMDQLIRTRLTTLLTELALLDA